MEKVFFCFVLVKKSPQFVFKKLLDILSHSFDNRIKIKSPKIQGSGSFGGGLTKRRSG